MRPQQKGLTNNDIEEMLNFDWDVSSDEESGDEVEDISAVLERNLEGIVERGESIEIDLLDNILADEVEQESSRRSTYKQYNPAKPHKWGFKMFTRAETTGMVYDFTKYVGEGTCPSYGLGLSSDVVLYLAQNLPKHKNFKLYFDNWFTSVSLLIALKEMGIFATGTIRKNR
ncbi:piggyBac transposable element-derived protein 1-like, partial [Rhagoletis pomonella]|uniref:piggyBac transposable element-derived protein 1-like n=1 Tax=Rhagoletis pomonella TaxID=28610 RepID=UPI001780147D